MSIFSQLVEALEDMLVFCRPDNPLALKARAALEEARRWEDTEGVVTHGGVLGHVTALTSMSGQEAQALVDRPAVLLVRKSELGEGSRG